MTTELTAEQWKLRALAAEGTVRYALWMQPFTVPQAETIDEYRKRLHAHVDASHPEQRIRCDHQAIEIFKLAELCGCDPKSDDYEANHCESDPDTDHYLCARNRLGFVCGTCTDEDGDGPEWKPYAVVWPCPPVAALNAAASLEQLRKAGAQLLASDAAR